MNMGKIVESILEKLQEGAELTADLLTIALAGKSGYRYEASRSSRYGPRKFKEDWSDWYKKRQIFYSLLNKLKREGLVVKKRGDKRSIWHITDKGIRKLFTMRNSKRSSGGILMQNYTKNKRKEITIISYDIPEKIRKKRYWLRSNLLALGFASLQKSVWIGTTEIPENFLIDLRSLDLLSYVHLFTVNKQGTIEQEI